MNRKSTALIPEAITQLQRQLEESCSTRPSRTQLPEALWQAASDFIVATALRKSHSDNPTRVRADDDSRAENPVGHELPVKIVVDLSSSTPRSRMTPTASRLRNRSLHRSVERPIGRIKI